MTETKPLGKVAAQIEKALDGRTRRWLSIEARIPEYDLSKKMNGGLSFREEELQRIELRLGVRIER